MYEDKRSEEVWFDINLRFLKEGSELAASYPKYETLITFRDAVRAEGRDSVELAIMTMKTIREAIQKYTMTGRELFETERDLFGAATKGVQAGDLVVVLQGCNAPVILREEGHGLFKLVGDTFTYGIMDGEVFDSGNNRLDLDLPPVQEFILK